jgi:hypothetical protein
MRARMHRARAKCARIVQALAVAMAALTIPAFAQAPKPEVRSGPDLPVWRTITLGVHRNVNAIRDAFERANIAVGDSADEVLGRPAFTFAQEPRTLSLVIISVAELGFDTKAALADIHARGVRLGLELCPEEVAPQLRLDYRQQPTNEFLHVAMTPQRMYYGDLVDFSLANIGARLALLGGDARPEGVMSAGNLFVFVRPNSPRVSSRGR